MFSDKKVEIIFQNHDGAITDQAIDEFDAAYF